MMTESSNEVVRCMIVTGWVVPCARHRCVNDDWNRDITLRCYLVL